MVSQVSKALEDADKCIALAPDFVKGYHRKVRRRADRRERVASISVLIINVFFGF